MQKAQRGAYAPLWCSCFSELFLFFLAGGSAALKPIPGCPKQADCFGCAGRGLPILQKNQFAALAPCCSCYVWSRILFLLSSFALCVIIFVVIYTKQRSEEHTSELQ